MFNVFWSGVVSNSCSMVSCWRSVGSNTVLHPFAIALSTSSSVLIPLPSEPKIYPVNLFKPSLFYVFYSRTNSVNNCANVADRGVANSINVKFENHKRMISYVYWSVTKPTSRPKRRTWCAFNYSEFAKPKSGTSWYLSSHYARRLRNQNGGFVTHHGTAAKRHWTATAIHFWNQFFAVIQPRRRAIFS